MAQLDTINEELARAFGAQAPARDAADAVDAFESAE